MKSIYQILNISFTCLSRRPWRVGRGRLTEQGHPVRAAHGAEPVLPGVVKVHVGIPCAVEGFPCSRRVRQLHARRQRLFLTHRRFPTRCASWRERYGVLLFHRNKRSVRLSELGERRLAVTQRLLRSRPRRRSCCPPPAPLQTGTLTWRWMRRCTYCRRSRVSASAIRGHRGAGGDRQYRRVSLRRLFSYQADLALLGPGRQRRAVAFADPAQRPDRRLRFSSAIRGPGAGRSASPISTTCRWCCASRLGDPPDPGGDEPRAARIAARGWLGERRGRRSVVARVSRLGLVAGCCEGFDGRTPISTHRDNPNNASRTIASPSRQPLRWLRSQFGAAGSP